MHTIDFRDSLGTDSGGGAVGKGEAWIDIEAADDAGRGWLASQSGLDGEIVSRLLEPATASYWRRFGDGIHFHARTPVLGADLSTVAIVDFGIWLEPGRIITVRHGDVPALARAAKVCATGEGPSGSWELIVFVLSEALGQLEQSLHELTATLDQLEDEALTAEGDPPLDRIAELQKRLVFARRFRMSVASMISFVSSQPGAAIEGALRDELEAMVNVFAQYQELLRLSIDRASALQGQIRDQLADSMNTATYRFTWVATVFLPLSFFTGLLGINVAGIPGDHDPWAFWLVCGGLCFVALAWGIAVGRLTGQSRRRRRCREAARPRAGGAPANSGM